jgi:pyruvate,water dikinase
MMKPYEAHALFGGGDQRQYDLRKIRFGPDDLPDLKASLWKIILRMPFSLALLYTRRYSKAKDLLEDLKQKNKYYGSISLESMSSSQLYQYIVEILERVISKLDLLYLIPGLVPAGIVVLLCNKWMHDRHQVVANTLLKAAGDMDDVQAGVALVQLAQTAQQDEQVYEVIRTEKAWEQVKRQLCVLNTDRKFLEAWDGFMDRHGHHCRSEILLSNPRWSEKPDYVLQLLKGCLYESDHDTPGHRYGQQIREQKKVVDQTLKQLKNPVKRWFLRKLVKRAQHGLVFRENVKSEVVRLLTIIRRMILAMEQQLLDFGILKQTNDIFFLKYEELSSVVDGQADFDVAAIIAHRRQEYERFKAVDPPQVVIGKFDPDNYMPPSVNTDVSVFSGMSVCPGKVTGKARVILRSDEDQQVLPGEILVAPFTDPGWTPYFVNAAGIVMDQGGLLSHGSIVAREYGIPAVVNVGPATKIIQTGQLLEVDANQGMVRILS